MKMRRKLFALLGWIILCELIGIIGGLFTFSQIPTWYVTLVKPSFNPPNWIFGPVWTTLYALMGFAAYRVWSQGMKKISVRVGIILFFVQLFLNLLWSIIFFAQHNIPLAFVDITFLWISIAVLIIKFEKIDTLSSLVLIPYLFWVSFAMVLNYNLWLLNVLT